MSPLNTHMIKLKSGQNHAEIRIRAPVEIQLTGKLQNINGKGIKGGCQVFFDQAIERRERISKAKSAYFILSFRTY